MSYIGQVIMKEWTIYKHSALTEPCLKMHRKIQFVLIKESGFLETQSKQSRYNYVAIIFNELIVTELSVSPAFLC